MTYWNPNEYQFSAESDPTWWAEQSIEDRTAYAAGLYAAIMTAKDPRPDGFVVTPLFEDPAHDLAYHHWFASFPVDLWADLSVRERLDWQRAIASAVYLASGGRAGGVGFSRPELELVADAPEEGV